MSKGWLIGTDTHHSRGDSERWAGQFHIFKATEGATFVDSKFKKMLAGWQQEKIYPYPIGVYHFLSEKSRIDEQINHFIDTIRPLKGKAMIILDYEAGFSKADANGKCLTDAVKAITFLTNNAQIVLYMNKSDAGKIIRTTEIPKMANVCLWIADYVGDYKNTWKPIMRQVCTSPCDIDVFYGNELSWDAIARSWK